MDGWRIGRLVAGGTVLLAVGLVLSALVAPGHDGGQRAGTGEPEVVAVRVTARGCGASTTGSGFVVGDRVITNAHVVAGAETFVVDTGPTSGFAVEVEVSGQARGLDGARSAQLDPGLGLPWAPLADDDPAPGTAVWMQGWVDGVARTTRGTIHLVVDGGAYGADGPVVLIEGATTFGFSGGPVLDDRGRVVAMLQSVEEVTSLTLAVPVSELRTWLSSDIENDAYGRCLQPVGEGK